MNKDISKLSGGMFYLIVAFLLIWTATLDYNFIRRVLTEQPFLAIFGLILFDGGMLGWLTTYIYRARGTTQRALSFVMTLLSLLGIILLSAAELMEQAGELTQWAFVEKLPMMVVILLSVQTALFVAATVIYHLSDPDIMERTNLQAIEDQVLAQAFDLFEKNSKQPAKKLATEMSAKMVERLVEVIDNRLDPEAEFEYEIKRHKRGYSEAQEKRKARRAARRAEKKAEQNPPEEKGNSSW